MPTFEFILLLADKSVLTDAEADALYEAGCDDCTLATPRGFVLLDFRREAPTLVEAIQSAMAGVRRAGLRVARVVIEAEAMEGVTA